MKRFNELKVGDTITARYYENIVIRLKAPGEKDVDSGTLGATRGDGARPAGTVAEQRTITATITQLDPKVPSITFTGPNGWWYSSRVEDKEALSKVKVGDKVDITWTAAALVSIEDGGEEVGRNQPGGIFLMRTCVTAIAPSRWRCGWPLRS